MTLSTRFEEALIFATRLHAGQTRKGTAIPYISHLLAVTGIVLEHGGNEDEAIAALLHDAVEDQGGTATLEDAWTTPKLPWRERKEAYLARLPGATASVHLVSIADKLHNAQTILSDYRTLGESLWSRFNGGKEGTLWYYRALVKAFQPTSPVPLVEELARVVSEIERLASTKVGEQGIREQ
jgi:(p)ppGpp synthase/HD superfamily hydrolase